MTHLSLGVALIGLYVPHLTSALGLMRFDEPLLITHLWSLVTALALVNHLDLRLRALMGETRGAFGLDAAGLSALCESSGLTPYVHPEGSFTPEVIDHQLGFTEISETLPETPLETLLKTLRDPARPTADLTAKVTPLEGRRVMHLRDCAEAKILPRLPQIEGREQVGLFASQTIEAGVVFVWRSDLTVSAQRASDDTASDPSNTKLERLERLNRRPLARAHHTTHDGTFTLEVSQGASEHARSEPATLVNFAWCNTESVGADSSPYRLLPPHDLGRHNCHFASVIDPDASSDPASIKLCSALITTRQLEPGDQLLAFTGSGASLRAVNTRRFISMALSLITPALVLLPWLRLVSALQ